MKDLGTNTHIQAQRARLDALRKRIGRDPALNPAEAKELEDLSEKLGVVLNKGEKSYIKVMKNKGKTKEPGRLALIVICSIFAIGAASAASNSFLSADKAAPNTPLEETASDNTPKKSAQKEATSTPATPPNVPKTNQPVSDSQQADKQRLDTLAAEIAQKTLCLNLNSAHYPKYQYALADSRAEYERNVAAIESDPQYQGSLHINKRRELIEAEQASWGARNAAAKATFNQTMASGGCANWLIN